MIKNIIAKAFGITVGRIDWPSTFKLAAMRSAAGGLAMGLIALIGGNIEGFFYLSLFGAPVGLFFMIPMALFGLVGGKVFWPLGLLGLVPLVYMVAGDPILWAIEKVRPGTIPVAEFSIINGKTIIIIVDDGSALDLSVSNLVRSEAVSSLASNVQWRGSLGGSAQEAGAQRQREQSGALPLSPDRQSTPGASFRLSQLAESGAIDRPGGQATDQPMPQGPSAVPAEPAPMQAGQPVGADQPLSDTDALIAQSERFAVAEARFLKLREASGDPHSMREQMMIIAQMCDEGCQIPAPYIFMANTFAKIDAEGRFEMIMRNLEVGHEACASHRPHQEEIELEYCVIGRLLWNAEEDHLAFQAYMSALRHWQAAGNMISQSSPVQYRIAFVAARMFSKRAFDRGDAEMAGQFLDLCEVFGVDMNLEIDVSDAVQR